MVKYLIEQLHNGKSIEHYQWRDLHGSDQIAVYLGFHGMSYTAQANICNDWRWALDVFECLYVR